MTADVHIEDSLPLSAELPINVARQRFEEARKAVKGERARPAIDAPLESEAGAERAALLRESLALDVDHRRLLATAGTLASVRLRLSPAHNAAPE
jgi:hypothetical protein